MTKAKTSKKSSSVNKKDGSKARNNTLKKSKAGEGRTPEEMSEINKIKDSLLGNVSSYHKSSRTNSDREPTI